jgi:SAM-dependent methyltransferase
MKSLVRRLLWKLTRKDCLILNPGWSVISHTGKHMLAGEHAADGKRYLPVSCNYHFSRDWLLEYRIHGNSVGTLRYKLCVPNRDPFCAAEMSIKLPFTWWVRLSGDGLTGNDSPLPLMPGAAIPREAIWLVGAFEFESENEGILVRHTGHRLRFDAGSPDQDYFQGAVYEDYDRQARQFPGQILQAISRHHPLSGKMLDIGCATGMLVKEALSKGLDAFGVDFSSWAVKKANALTDGRCRVLNMDEATVADFDSMYDIITMHSVIEHLLDPRRTLELLFKIIRPGGILYIQTLHAGSLAHRMFGTDWEGFTDYTHKSPWLSVEWLSNHCSQIGFECLEINNGGFWSENAHDEVLSYFKSVIQLYPASLLLQEGFGDALEIILRKSGKNP